MPIKTGKVKLSAVGDIMLGDFPACYGFGVRSQIEKYGADYPFIKCQDVLKDSDILFGNLEAVLSSKNRNKLWLPSLYMRGDSNAVSALKNCGFKVLSLANNHMLQHGEEAFKDTINILKNNAICPIGLKNEHGYHTNPVFIEEKNIILGFLGYSLRPEEYCSSDVLYCQGNESKIFEDIEKLRGKVDCLVISLHWGDEYIQQPSPSQIELARRMIDAGADVILGHHPHVLQGIETYKNGLIAYSLGNFVFDMWMPETRESIVLEVVIDKNGVDDYKIIPIKINDTYQPEIINCTAKDNFLNKFEELCKYIDDSRIMEKEKYEKLVDHYFDQYREGIIKHYKQNIFRFNTFYFFELVFLVFYRRLFNKHL